MNNPEMADQRQFTRIPFESPVHIHNAQGKWTSQLIDISLNGILIHEPTGWDVSIGDQVQIELDLHDSDIEIRMEVEVAHMEKGHVGLHCKHIDLDSITHLRRLVELNLGNTEILSRELSALGR
ncbi:PilZ domain-containing protein [Kaarinaea lacus]